MTRRNRVGTALVGLAVVLFVVPALFPVQPMLVHDTGRTTNAPPAELRAEGVAVVAYENLSDRGQELYVETLRRGGEFRVPEDEGAPEFDYPNASERRAAFEESGSRPGIVVIERPVNGSLPESDEVFFLDADEEALAEKNETRLRRRALRYDMMTTGTRLPPLRSPPQLVRLGAALLAVVSLGTGGYLLSSK